MTCECKCSCHKKEKKKLLKDLLREVTIKTGSYDELAKEAIRAVEEIVEDLLKSGKWYNINSEAFKDYLKRELLGDA